MPNVIISIGGRPFEVACQEGEEAFLQSAAGLLDTETHALGDQAAKLPESRMLLMAGLMLADRTAGLAESLREVEAQLAEARGALEAVENADPKTIEVPIVPEKAAEMLADLTAEAEALADQLDEQAAKR
ncbi:MAG: cell division protein ZapA [Rhodobacterales bacterium]|nr:MAG: cell division protein ZapA [Rhodobacterales bacterium]